MNMILCKFFHQNSGSIFIHWSKSTSLTSLLRGGRKRSAIYQNLSMTPKFLDTHMSISSINNSFLSQLDTLPSSTFEFVLQNENSGQSSLVTSSFENLYLLSSRRD